MSAVLLLESFMVREPHRLLAGRSYQVGRGFFLASPGIITGRVITSHAASFRPRTRWSMISIIRHTRRGARPISPVVPPARRRSPGSRSLRNLRTVPVWLGSVARVEPSLWHVGCGTLFIGAVNAAPSV